MSEYPEAETEADSVVEGVLIKVDIGDVSVVRVKVRLGKVDVRRGVLEVNLIRVLVVGRHTC